MTSGDPHILTTSQAGIFGKTLPLAS